MFDCCWVVMARATFSVKNKVKLRHEIGKFKVFFLFKVLGRREKWIYLSPLPVKNVFLFILIPLFALEMCKKPCHAFSVITNPKFIALSWHYYYTAQNKKALGSYRWHSNSPSSSVYYGCESGEQLLSQCFPKLLSTAQVSARQRRECMDDLHICSFNYLFYLIKNDS